MIYIHGGGWQRGDKAAVGSKPAYFCSRGWVFVSLNYRFVPAVDLLTQLQDSADAIAWVHTHIADHGGDPQQLHLMGHSAGAHHVAILATNERFLKAAGKELSILKSVVELDTQALDVPRMMHGSENATYVQAFGKDERLWREVSPLHHVAKGKGIPAVLPGRGGQSRAETPAGRRFPKGPPDRRRALRIRRGTGTQPRLAQPRHR